MGDNFWVMGEVDHAIVYGQRALALAATLGHVGLQARAQLILGQAYYDAGDYPRAVESLGRNVAALQGSCSLNALAQWPRRGSFPGLAEPLPRRTWRVHGGARHGRRRAPDRRDRPFPLQPD